MPDTPIADRSERDELATIVHQSRAIRDTPDETADTILAAGYRRVSADPDTVERVARDILHELRIHEAERYPVTQVIGSRFERMPEAIKAAARAAINAIGGGQDAA